MWDDANIANSKAMVINHGSNMSANLLQKLLPIGLIITTPWQEGILARSYSALNKVSIVWVVAGF
ncbi:MAG: hypothetical protein ACI9LM_002511 [Alteromonadaceae bacterium]|jgi:hypothetical protein